MSNLKHLLVYSNKGLAGKADYVAFATDYENYGAIYSCQSILFGHRRSASILSRRPTLDQPFINKVRSVQIISCAKHVKSFCTSYALDLVLV
jgi:hypothetical protein